MHSKSNMAAMVMSNSNNCDSFAGKVAAKQKDQRVPKKKMQFSEKPIKC